MKSIIKISASILLLLLVNYAMPADAATTYHFGAVEKQLSSATDEVAEGAYGATSLSSVCPSLTVSNIRSGVNIFGLTGIYSGSGTTYGLPKTTQTSVSHAASGTDLGDDATVSAGWPGKGQAETSRWTTVESTKTPGSFIMVKDNATGLIWERRGDMPLSTNEAESGGLVNPVVAWDAAFTYVKSLNDSSYGGYTDWRLPNIKELTSILNHQASSPACYETTNSTGQFTGTKNLWYWSSTTLTGSTSWAWRVIFSSGNVQNTDKTTSANLYVRAVRGGI